MSSPENFLQRTRHAKKVMVLDLGFLGDTVHLLPALWMVRQAYPQAELHVTVASHITSLMDCVPWVNRVWGYMRYPRHATLRENLDMVRRERLGRMPDDGGPPFWKRMFTAHVHHPFTEEPVYQQRCRCLEKAGFSSAPPEFNVEIPEKNLSEAGISEAERGTYFHISPFTTADSKELAPSQLVSLFAILQTRFPERKLVLSCAPVKRELEKMENLLALLPLKPWRVFAGSLNLMQLAAVIQHSALHFCGDTGPFHLAVMTNTPTVAWFWPNPGLRQWLPNGGPFHVSVGANAPGTQFLSQIATDELVTAAGQLARERRFTQPGR